MSLIAIGGGSEHYWSSPQIARQAGTDRKRQLALRARLVHATCSSAAVTARSASTPTRRAMYMYQRRSVAEAPSSPAAARSRQAREKCDAHTAAKTTAAHPIWEVERLLEA